MTYETLEEAFLFVSAAPHSENSAVINRKTGELFFASEEMTDLDELPEDADENDDYIYIPHQNDLDLGKPVVMDFVRNRCPNLIDRVQAIFRRKGAYGRFRDLLMEKNLLDDWYTFEQQRIREALLQWCEENKIVLD
ncbi:UPF0158 family protein [Desulfuromonas acetexigens]|uniref:Uncharacterized protein n=1 Tax=Trichloromonas acetexigens TaxID=38815 RepID=A0A550J8T4_9BACT|nr:UPF0158 family protein [Desulfuromonas acetexigens]TRO79657.1 hypothetical protein FL622_12145 [Desulfuromonas acetexigens]